LQLLEGNLGPRCAQGIARHFLRVAQVNSITSYHTVVPGLALDCLKVQNSVWAIRLTIVHEGALGESLAKRLFKTRLELISETSE